MMTFLKYTMLQCFTFLRRIAANTRTDFTSPMLIHSTHSGHANTRMHRHTAHARMHTHTPEIQDIITSFIFKFRASSLTWHLAGYRVRKFRVRMLLVLYK
jgi:hypothetical protein